MSVNLYRVRKMLTFASALMGNEEGDEVTVKAPKGDIIYEILEVQYI